MKGLSLEEINELFGDPVAVRITYTGKGDNEELEKRLEGYNIHGNRKVIDTHIENVPVNGEKDSEATSETHV